MTVLSGQVPKPDPEDIAGRVNDLCELSGEDSKLSDWEIDFVDSVAKQLDLCRIVSAAQKSKVLELHRKHCGGS